MLYDFIYIKFPGKAKKEISVCLRLKVGTGLTLNGPNGIIQVVEMF